MTKLETITAEDLQNRTYEPTHFLVDELIPEGLHILAGAHGQLLRRHHCHAPRGEFVVVVEGAQQAPVEAITLDAGAALVRAEMEKGLSKKDAVKLVAKQTGLPRNALYEAALQDKD